MNIRHVRITRVTTGDITPAELEGIEADVDAGIEKFQLQLKEQFGTDLVIDEIRIQRSLVIVPSLSSDQEAYAVATAYITYESDDDE